MKKITASEFARVMILNDKLWEIDREILLAAVLWIETKKEPKVLQQLEKLIERRIGLTP